LGELFGLFISLMKLIIYFQFPSLGPDMFFSF